MALAAPCDHRAAGSARWSSFEAEWARNALQRASGGSKISVLTSFWREWRTKGENDVGASKCR